MHERRGFPGRIRDLFSTAIFGWGHGPARRAAQTDVPASQPCPQPMPRLHDLDLANLDHMMWMLDCVLEQARAFETPSRIEPVDVRDLLIDIVARRDPARLLLDPTPCPLHVLARPPEIEGLFAILVARALSGEARTVIRLDRGTNAMVAHFDDNGPGVPRHARDAMFVFSADRHPAENALATAWQIASALGGNIRIASSPEGGARFSVRLPTISESEIAYSAAS